MYPTTGFVAKSFCQPVLNAPTRQWLHQTYPKWYDARPQVSRRLARRLHSENKPGKLGFVQLVAEAYLALLRGMPAEDSVLFAKELIVQRVVRSSIIPQILLLRTRVYVEAHSHRPLGVFASNRLLHATCITTIMQVV